jgi:hypothetical protein
MQSSRLELADEGPVAIGTERVTIAEAIAA